MATMMNSPEAQASVANMLNNPAVIDQVSRSIITIDWSTESKTNRNHHILS
jgi:hypothetical protein